jgi:hypothetical protein
VQECYQRTESVQPQQALALLNSRLAVQSARRLARDIDAKTGTDPMAFIDLAFRTLFSRPATDDEARICAEHLNEQTPALADNADARRGATDDLDDTSRPAADPALRAREGLVHLLINHHEFITIR